MPNTLLSARDIYDIAPLGSLIRFSDGTPEPPARHRRKRIAWISNNGAARLVRKNPADHLSGPSFALHLGNVGSGDVTVVEAYRIITMASVLSYAIQERPRPGQAAVLQDESGIHSLIHLADTEDDALRWLHAHPHRNARIVPAGAPEPCLFTYLQDPGHGWLIVRGADLAAAGMTRAEFSMCSYVSGDCLALEEDCDMPLFLKHLDERGIAWRLREHHTNADACVRCWESNLVSETRSAARPAQT
ncbi:MAG TPA: hypothetical protein VGF29_03590 [Hyphomicrobiaceae bacterium]|jgi:hypothetical protein